MEQLMAGSPSNYYNLGNGRGFSVREVIHSAERVLGRKVQVVEGAKRPGDPPILLANPQKARREINWHPCYPLEAMIEHAWQAYT
jgi:UDP-glucose 4-epimerase